MLAMSSEPLQDHRALDWLAVAAASRIVAKVRDDHLDGATPCTGWRVRDLLRHMVGNNFGFAAAARGTCPDERLWNGVELPEDPRELWHDAAQEVITAFSELPDLSGTMKLPGCDGVPAGQAVSMHFIDYLTHGWDVAVSIGVDPDLDEESCREVLRIATTWPAGSPAIWRPGAAFGHPVDVPDTAPPADRMLGLLGRSASWHPVTRG